MASCGAKKNLEEETAPATDENKAAAEVAEEDPPAAAEEAKEDASADYTPPTKDPKQLTKKELKKAITTMLTIKAKKTEAQIKELLRKNNSDLAKLYTGVKKKYYPAPAEPKEEPKKKTLQKQHSAEALPKATTLRSWDDGKSKKMKRKNG